MSMKPEMITWARERVNLSLDELVRKRGLSKLREWESGEIQPTFSELRNFAERVNMPLGFLSKSKPPEESLKMLQVEDFRTSGSQEMGKPSPNLLDMVGVCKRRQNWYREYAIAEKLDPVNFVGSVKPLKHNHKDVAESMAKSLKFGLGTQEKFRSVKRALQEFRNAAEAAGVLVMISKYGRNKYFKNLDVNEFRGFALSDHHVPLVFINGADYEPAQMFTLAHELAHLWLGDTGVSAVDAGDIGKSRYSKKEAWCNRVAAEFLVPMAQLEDIDAASEDFRSCVAKQAKRLHVSKQVILRRLHDKRRLDRSTYEELSSFATDNAPKTRKTAARVTKKKARSNGQASKPAKVKAIVPVETEVARLVSRVGKNFAIAVATSTLETKTTHVEAYRMLGSWRFDALESINRRMHEL